ncbi:tRNA (adenosine(37)-N6)-dimethylallyltransferase MiaA [Microbacterium oleivorans]|uniref:tRNA (adenosine(37)-N6)-dimethylallyltransferase MiaA n=1 Tax=Microbacterium oleivorans TaxID=273677 RepID=UPI0010A34D0C|nr:tRNA (adenosine(37)-N6)-dimethylallyltransferase MiaA [Microbacterium oleivorans]THE07478.1 tRNA (adenosine(37)-N6)-dimethylallyltransferase MiaA [Microbacterium oleivorans]
MGAPRLWAIVGATGTGKTALSLDLAEELIRRGRGAEIFNADAMQLYRGMDIGTAKVPVAERRGIPHHLFDEFEVTEDVAVAVYQERARAAIQDVFDRGSDAILVGGSGLYVSSVVFDFRFPPRDPALRTRLEADLAEQGSSALIDRIRGIDPAAADRLDPRNSRRVVRALEVVLQGAETHGAALPDAPVLWQPDTVLVGVHLDRATLVGRLDERVQGMWCDGILAEVDSLRSHGLESGPTAPRAIGYAQALAQLAGRMTEAEAIAETQALTRRYARRQVSWFRRYPDIRWVDAGTPAARLVEDFPAPNA